MSVGKPRPWKILLAELRRRVRENNATRWDLADILLEALPVGKAAPPRGVPVAERGPNMWQRQQVLAREMGCSTGRVAKHRMTANRWPRGHRCPTASYWAHEILNGHEDRFELIKTIRTADEARLLLGKRTRDHGPSAKRLAASIRSWGKTDPDRQAALIRPLLANPGVLECVLGDPELATRIRLLLPPVPATASRPRRRMRIPMRVAA